MSLPHGCAIGPGARLALLVNPVARRAGRTSRVEAAANVLRRRFQVDLIVPADPAAIAEAARAAASSHDGIVVLGGDGTLNRVVNALGNGAVPIGLLIPSASCSCVRTGAPYPRMCIAVTSQSEGKSSRSSSMPEDSCVGMTTDFADPFNVPTCVAW